MFQSSEMGVDNLLHYGKIRWLHGADKEGGSATIRNNFITGKGKRDNENEATLFSMCQTSFFDLLLFVCSVCYFSVSL